MAISFGLSVILVCVLLSPRSSAQCPVLCKCSSWSVSCKNSQYTDVPSDVLQSGVIKLDLSSNKITSLLNHSFPAGLSSVENLLLANNRIRSIEVDSLGSLVSLNLLDLSGNEIRYIEPDVFSSHTHLMSLNLTNNPNLKLPENGYELPELVKLELERCTLSQIPANFFKNMKQIRFLYLSKNEISFLEPTNFKHLTNLAELDLSDNWFKVLQRDLLQLHSSTKLKVTQNPWICDCDFKFALDILEQRKNYKPLICKSPKQFRGTVANKTAINELLHCDASRPRTTTTTTTTTTAEVYDTFGDYDQVYPGDDRLANIVDPGFETSDVPTSSPQPLVDEDIVALFSSSEPDTWLGENQWWMICGAVVLAACVVVAVINTQVNTRRTTHVLTNVHYNADM